MPGSSPTGGQADRASGEHHLPRRRPARPDQRQVEHGQDETHPNARGQAIAGLGRRRNARQIDPPRRTRWTPRSSLERALPFLVPFSWAGSIPARRERRQRITPFAACGEASPGRPGPAGTSWRVQEPRKHGTRGRSSQPSGRGCSCGTTRAGCSRSRRRR